MITPVTSPRQSWIGFALLLLSLGLPAVAVLSGADPVTGLQAATLVAGALLLMLLAARTAVPAVVPVIHAVPATRGPAAVLLRLAPDAPGRPLPRAPGRVPAARHPR